MCETIGSSNMYFRKKARHRISEDLGVILG